MINIRIKHIVILLIVFLTTFFVILFNYFTLLSSPTFNIGFLYSGLGTKVQSEEMVIWNALERVQAEFAVDTFAGQYEEINLNAYNKNKLTNGQLKEIVVNKDILYVLGDQYNDLLVKEIKENKKTKFILINNSGNFLDNNVINIVVDQQHMLMDSALTLAQMSINKKIIYITTDAKAQGVEIFKENASGTQIAVKTISDVNNNVEITKILEELFMQGYDGIYIADPELNEVVITKAKSKQSRVLNKKTDLTVVEATPSPVLQISVISTLCANHVLGIYNDTNSDDQFAYPDDSVVKEAYIIQYHELFSEINNEVINNVFNPRTETFIPEKYSLENFANNIK